MIGDGVEVIAVGRRLRIGGDEVQQAIQVLALAMLLIPEVGKPGHVNLKGGVYTLDGQVSRLQQPVIILLAPRPGVTGMIHVRHVRLVPDDPMAYAPLILLRHPAHKMFPIAHVGDSLRAAASVGGRPGRGTHQHGDYFASGGQLGFDERIGHIGRFPVIDAPRLNHVPSKRDTRITCSSLGGSR